MTENSSRNQKRSLNISDNDDGPPHNEQNIEETSSDNACSNSRQTATVNNLNTLDNKISNLHFSLNATEKTSAKSKVSFSPDDNLASSHSSSGNEDDNIEYKFIEKNLNISSLSDNKFDLFFKKNLNEGDTNLEDNLYATLDEFKSVLHSEEGISLGQNQHTLILDDDVDVDRIEFDPRLYKKLNTNGALSHDDDFIEEDFVPLNTGLGNAN